MSEAGILTGNEIIKRVAAHDINITPFDGELVNPASVDLRLGGSLRMYSMSRDGHALDVRQENRTVLVGLKESGFVITPGTLYLMHTLERIHTDKYVTVLDGKSSIGRLGIKVHETAGYIDPGFNGQPTLEVTCVHPVRIYPGMRFCQVRFHTLLGHVSLYGGASSHYTGGNAEGPVPSMSWQQFKKDDV